VNTHPYLATELARGRVDDLLADAERRRLVRAVRGAHTPRRAGVRAGRLLSQIVERIAAVRARGVHEPAHAGAEQLGGSPDAVEALAFLA
jgi:hypothetical protein